MVAGCEPDYSETAFLCDVTHGCSEQQACVGGRCRRGGAAGTVGCGVGGVCTPEQQCCVDSSNPPRCIPAGDECPGYGALCDGIGDCQQGDACCYGLLTYCHAECKLPMVYTVCTVDPDCPSAEPHCCPDADVPWGYCQFGACS